MANQEPATGEAEIQKLIQESTSMSAEEKSGWIQMLPKMSKSQKRELIRILETEKKKLEEIEKKYSKELENIERNYIAKYLSSEARKRWEDARKREEASQHAAHAEAESVLSQLE